MKRYITPILLLLLLTLAACGGGQTPNPTPTVQAANGFGTAQNHTHSLVVLPDAQHTLVMATHYGIFRSVDQGKTWTKTAAGANQLMQGLMTSYLSYNPLDPQRLYVMTLPATYPHAGILALYTSPDGGQTWQ